MNKTIQEYADEIGALVHDALPESANFILTLLMDHKATHRQCAMASDARSATIINMCLSGMKALLSNDKSLEGAKYQELLVLITVWVNKYAVVQTLDDASGSAPTVNH